MNFSYKFIKYFKKIGVLILLINGPILGIISSSYAISLRTYSKETTKKIIFKVPKIVNNSELEHKNFILKEFPDFSLDKLKKTVKSNKDPFRDTSQYINENSFEDLYIELLGLFKINEEINAMFRTPNGIKNYLIGDKILNNFEIEDINLTSNEVSITNGKESKIYKFPEK